MDFEEYAKSKAMSGAISDNWISAFEQNFLQKRIGKGNELKVLDFGFGDGRYYDYFKKLFPSENIYGVEVSKIRLERAKYRGWINVSLIEPTTRLPYPDQFFDFINMVEVIEHIPQDKLDFCFNEIKRVMKQDAILILTTPNYPIKRFYDFCHALSKRKPQRFFDDPTHISKFSVVSLKRFLDRHFNNPIIASYKDGFLYHYLKKQFFLHKILAVCQKTN